MSGNRSRQRPGGVGDEQPGKRQAESEIARARFFATLVEHAPHPFAVINPDGSARYVSPSLAAVLGHTQEGPAAIPLQALVHPRDLAQLAIEATQALESTGPADSTHVRARHADGTWRTLEVSVADLREHPEVGAIVLALHDVTAARDLANDLRHRADHDTLTGLLTWQALMTRLRTGPEAAAGTQTVVASVLLSAFDRINDAFGHDTGDAVLAETAARLRQLAGEDALIARAAGAEFVIAAADVDPEDLAVQVVAALRTPVRVAEQAISLQVAVGVAAGNAGSNSDPSVATGDVTGKDTETLLRRSQSALFEAHRRPGGGWVVDGPRTALSAARRREVESDLRAAIAAGQIELRYQPVFSLRTRTLVGAEAQLRWNHPRYGLLPPAVFRQVAEQSGLGTELGQLVLRQACESAADWPTELAGGGEREEPYGAGDGSVAPWVSVRIGARQLPTLERAVRSALESSGLDPARLRLDVPALALAPRTAHPLKELEKVAATGVGIAIDRFDTDVEIVKNLAAVPSRMLKIAPGLVADCDRDPVNAALVAAVVRLGQATGRAVTACGVESASQLDAVARLGCDEASGLALTAPLTVHGFVDLLSRGGTLAHWAP